MRTVPFRMHRVVTWGETDPAGIVYTPRFLDYAVEAVEAWFKDVIGIDWYRLRRDHGMGSPMVHASLDFRKPLFPADPFSLEVIVEAVGGSSISYAVTGRNQQGEECFTAKLVSAIIDAERIRARRVPDEFRTRIEAYRAACLTAAQAGAGGGENQA